jgi:uncharacterized membrane protein
MNRLQKIALLVAAGNLAVILLFPPFDTYSFTAPLIPIFAGFHPIFSRVASETINSSLLFLETAIILINASIAWLLLQPSPPSATRRRIDYQHATLLVVAVNLVLLLLFPPFENYQEVTLAILPSFQGFYFIFTPHPDMTIVSTMLYLEVIFVLINGGILWLLFRKKKEPDLSPGDVARLMKELQRH